VPKMRGACNRMICADWEQGGRTLTT
jgi:hypothetical protein